MPIQDYPHLTLWKELGFDRLPVIPFETWIASYQEKAVKRLYAKSVYHIGFNAESHENIKEDLRDRVSLVLYGMIQDKADDVTWLKGIQLIEASKVARLKGNNGLAEGLDITSQPGGGIKFINNELWALKQCYQELQACIKEVRRANYIPLKADPFFDWNEARVLDLAAPKSLSWLGDLFHSDELPFFVCYTVVNAAGKEILYTRVTDCALEILCKRLRLILRYEISKRSLHDKLKKIPD